jgi:hypothetical protein
MCKILKENIIHVKIKALYKYLTACKDKSFF